MGICKYCGKKAGFLSSKHDECEQLHAKGLHEAENLFYSFLCQPQSASVFNGRVKQLQADCFVGESEKAECAAKALKKFTEAIHRPFTHAIEQNVKQLLSSLNVSRDDVNKEGVLKALAQKLIKGYMVAYFTNGATETQVRGDVRSVTSVMPLSAEDENEAYMYVLNKAAENFLKDGILTDKEESLIRSFAQAFYLPIDNPPVKYKNTDLAKIGEMTVLKNFAKGIVPSTFVQLPILLGKTESLLWTYNNVTFYEEKVEKEYLRNSGGFSFKVMKGVYYHTGTSKGRPIEHKYM